MTRNTLSLLLGITLLFASCEEDTEAPTSPNEDKPPVAVVVSPPKLAAQRTTIATLIKFNIEVEAEQVQDTAYYVVLADDAEAVSAAALINHAATTALPMQGKRTRTGLRNNLKENTNYVVYALIKQGNDLSKVTSLAMTTGAAE